MATSPTVNPLPLAVLLWVAVVAMPVAIAASDAPSAPAATENATGPDATALFRAVVKVRTRAVSEARSTATLGAEREGTGILIGKDAHAINYVSRLFPRKYIKVFEKLAGHRLDLRKKS